MFLVVFGAGASFDSVPDPDLKRLDPDSPFRPPLAKDLFDPSRQHFRERTFEYIEGAGLIGEIRSRVRDGAGVEAALEKFVAEAEAGDPETRRALLAIRFYIKDVIAKCATEWQLLAGGVTNYRILFNQLERWRRLHDDRGLLVTFNYDALLESALGSSGRVFASIEDYVSRTDYRLIKPHGSVQWERWVDVEATSGPQSLIERAAELDLTSGPIGQGRPRASKTDYPSHVPAIAVPTETKTTFECPPEHLAALEEWLSDVDRILVIGWRGQEKNFLEILTRHLGTRLPVHGLVVDISQEQATGVAAVLTDALPSANIGPSAAAGFSQFVASDEPVTRWLEGKA